MAKKTFKSVQDLMKYIKDEVYDSLNTDVKDKVVEKTKKKIEETVYSEKAYEYDRTFELLNSVVGNTYKDKNYINLTIFHDTDLINPYLGGKWPQHTSIKPRGNDVSDMIPEWIIEGTEGSFYNHPGEDYLQKTVSDLNSDKEHINTLKKSLNRKGIKTK